MKVSILQRDIVWAKPEENVKRANQVFDRLPKSDLYVLPEMFSTGFATQPEGIAESANSDTLQWMKQKAAQFDAAIVGSIAVKDGEQYFNRMYFVEPDGNVTIYNKRHLFTYGGEDRHFTSGDGRVIVSFRGIRFMLEVCYDLRFPVWSRNRGDFDAIIYVASWPVSRVKAWSSLLVARAIENQCFVIGVNRVGKDPNCEYNGASVILDPYGEVLASCPLGQETETSVEMNMELLEQFRQKFPVLNDADSFDIKN